MTTTPNEICEFTAKINQEIKDKKLTSKDPEYFRLKMKECYHRKLKEKMPCPACGRILAYRTLQRGHKCYTIINHKNDLNK